LGDVSKRDVDLLHSLRFLGNDAVHELEIPGIQDIKVAFNIIEHLIQSIYIMPNELKNTNFKIYIDEYEKFEKIIIENIKNELSFNNELSYSAKKLISPNGIISKENLIQFEDQLKNRISSGDLDWIQVSQNINSNDENNSINETFYKIIQVP
ncbi:hypothetical protein ACH8I4_17980, partial [Acinetobacter sp. ABJ_C3_5]|uniref:hypothetical protein n=1 Tax=Acinetobacter courvalinii TaxID=280147 RepID=UPI0037C7A5A8